MSSDLQKNQNIIVYEDGEIEVGVAPDNEEHKQRKSS